MMNLVKRTYTLPAAAMHAFESQVPAGERSALVASLVQHWLEEARRKTLRREVVEGCAAMADMYLEIEKEYHPLEEEIHRAIDDQPTPRRRRARQTRSRGRVRTSR